MRNKIIMALLFLAIHSTQQAQTTGYDQPVKISFCGVNIEADPFAAKTVLELQLYNTRNREVEGLQYIKLNPNQIITGFELELNGKFREGSIEERGKATGAYRSIVGKRIDPAIITMIDQERYSLNVYPIPAKGSRTIRIIIEQLMEPDSSGMRYTMPLQLTDSTTKMQVNISVSKCRNAVFANKGLISTAEFIESKGLQQLKWYSENSIPNQPVSFSIHMEKESAIVCTGKQSGEFALAYLPKSPEMKSFNPKNMAVYWDVSTSAAANRDFDKELDFLEGYLKQKNIETVDCYLFNQQLKGKIRYEVGKHDFSVIRNTVKQVTCEGATRLGALDFFNVTADVIWLFSDAIQTLDQMMPIKGKQPIFCIVSSEQFDQIAMNSMLENNGGKMINLLHSTVEDGLKGIESLSTYLYAATKRDNYIQVKSGLPKLSNGLAVVLTGNAYRADTLTLLAGNQQLREQVKKIYINPAVSCDSQLLKRIHRIRTCLHLRKKGSHHENLLFGLEHKVVTMATAYLVLERKEDYIRYQIAPSPDLESSCAMDGYVYDNRILREALTKRFSEEQHLPLINSYRERMQWWGKEVSKEYEAHATLTGVQSNRTTTVGSTTSVQENVPIGTNAADLSSVVVTQITPVHRKMSLGHATAFVRQNELQQRSPAAMPDMLVGRVSGLQIERTEPGVFYQSRVNIRGLRSIHGSNQPLWILDHVPISEEMVQTISPNSINHIEVLKSPAATALYGSQGVNGVILINSKRNKGGSYPAWKSYSLAAMEDVDYILQIQESAPNERWDTYLALASKHHNKTGFYYDMADFFFKQTDTVHAKEIFYEAAESFEGSVEGIRALAYLLESWKQFDEAILLYKGLLSKYPFDLHTQRDLALAYFQSGDNQKAADVYQQIILQQPDVYETGSIKLLALNEWNALMALHPELIIHSQINQKLINPLPVDLYISLSSNFGSVNFYIEQPNGETSSAQMTGKKSDGYFEPSGYRNFDNPSSFSVKNAAKGKYVVKVDLYNYSASQQRIPHIVRVVHFRKFQSQGQTIEVNQFVVDNQYGLASLMDISFL